MVVIKFAKYSTAMDGVEIPSMSDCPTVVVRAIGAIKIVRFLILSDAKTTMTYITLAQIHTGTISN